MISIDSWGGNGWHEFQNVLGKPLGTTTGHRIVCGEITVEQACLTYTLDEQYEEGRRSIWILWIDVYMSVSIHVVFLDAVTCTCTCLLSKKTLRVMTDDFKMTEYWMMLICRQDCLKICGLCYSLFHAPS